MRKKNLILTVITILSTLLMPLPSIAFNSGSSGADGALDITEDTQLQLPPSGIFNYTNITIAEGATLTFINNVANTPVRLLVSGDVLIDGIIDVSGQQGHYSNQPPFGGRGGPGGFDGGRGGFPVFLGDNLGRDGQGPGGGIAGIGGPDGGIGGPDGILSSGRDAGDGNFATGSTRYGNPELLPLIGGSGGSGGGGGAHRGAQGGHGGGGGGALLIAASGTVTINGRILANGGQGEPRRGGVFSGGNGSGGAIRIVATTLTGEGRISASSPGGSVVGRIRLEIEDFNRVADTTPAYNFGSPGPLFIPNLPTLRISSVGGIAVPATPSGFRDIILPVAATNPVTVQFSTSNVPAGTTIALTVRLTQTHALVVTSQSIDANGTATVSITLPNGDNYLTAKLIFDVTASLGSDYSRYAQGHPVKQIKLDIDALGQSTTTFITDSGAEYTLPANALTLR